MYFECNHSVHSEDGFTFPSTFFNFEILVESQKLPYSMHGVQERVSLVPGFSEAQSIRRKWGWLGLVENYSKRKLTYSQDKLTALAGMARILAAKSNDRYRAGLWERHLIEDLSWRAYPHEEILDKGQGTKGEEYGEMTRVEDYRAPSWSWAYLDGPIKFVSLSFGEIVSQIISCETTPAANDPYGRVKDGKLVVAVSPVCYLDIL
jgi:hypothetical protein